MICEIWHKLPLLSQKSRIKLFHLRNPYTFSNETTHFSPFFLPNWILQATVPRFALALFWNYFIALHVYVACILFRMYKIRLLVNTEIEWTEATTAG